MKVKFKYGIGSYSGTLDLATFYETKNGNASFMRRWVKPRQTDNNVELGAVGKNLALIWAEASANYKADMETYCQLYNAYFKDDENVFQANISKYAMFTKMFYAFAKASGSAVDLKSLSYGDLDTLFPEVTNLASACDEGFLPFVPGAELLTESM